jgi:hypothetical protein
MESRKKERKRVPDGVMIYGKSRVEFRWHFSHSRPIIYQKIAELQKAIHLSIPRILNLFSWKYGFGYLSLHFSLQTTILLQLKNHTLERKSKTPHLLSPLPAIPASFSALSNAPGSNGSTPSAAASSISFCGPTNHLLAHTTQAPRLKTAIMPTATTV